MSISESLINWAIQSFLVNAWKKAPWRWQAVMALTAFVVAIFLPLFAYAHWVHPWLFGESFWRALPQMGMAALVVALTLYCLKWISNILFVIFIPGSKIEAKAIEAFWRICKKEQDGDELTAEELVRVPTKSDMPTKHEYAEAIRRMTVYILLDFLGADVRTVREVQRKRQVVKSADDLGGER